MVAAGMVSCLASCSSHKLFSDGKSDYVIAISPEAPESEQYAASELQYWIKEVSGATLPITDLSGGRKGKRIIVGYNDLVKESVPGAEKPKDRDDSFTVKSKGSDILLWGGCTRGTLYSVYSFLEEELDCRWYSVSVSVAHRKDSWSFSKLERQESPGIMIRDNCYLDPRTNPTFSARLRNNFVNLPKNGKEGTIPGTSEGYWGVHAMGYLMTPAEYYATHPEYFSLREGKRSAGYTQLCLSNPDVLRICTEKIREVMRNNPDYLIYSMEQNDNRDYCTCDECTAIAERYGGQSGLMIWFVNQVADAVKDEFPDKFIGTFAYQYTRHAPKDITPRENVVVRLCSIECCMLHGYDECEQNLSFAKDLDDWGKIAQHLYIWDYVTDFSEYCLPVANWKTIQPHIQDFRDNHAIGILEEGDYQTTSCELREMRTWILSKLMWNPDADMDALIKDFTDGYYGAAGPYIREYLDLEDRILRREGLHSWCYIISSNSMYTKEFIDEGRKIFAKAKETVSSDPEIFNRVETAEMPLCFLQMERYPVQGIREGADQLFKRVVEREKIDRMAEAEWSGGVIWAKDMIQSNEKIAKSVKEAPLFPAIDAKTGDNGVAFTRYEGKFLSTTEMIAKGRVESTGSMPNIEITEKPEEDHFGYVFKTLLKAGQDGVYQIDITTDDGSVLLIDGKTIIDLDGAHSPMSKWTIVNLAKGLHALELRYFDDCEDQSLELTVSSPDGYSGPLRGDCLFMPAE